MKPLAFTHLRAALTVALLAATVAALAACQPRHREHDPWTADGIELNVRSSDRSILAGQVVVLTADATNTLGREARIEWDAPGGEVTTEQGGRIAKIQYNRSGTYIVMARLYVDDNLHRTQTTSVTVQPVN